jgi:P-type Mg2+ transporter
MAMSHKKVIVKRLNSIQNLGAMDVLCTDKTGTLTMDRIILEKHCDVALKEDKEVLTLAYLNSHFQTGLKNLLDRAILQHEELKEHLALPDYAKVNEIPFDFSRRVMSVVVKKPDNTLRLICKGAPEEIYKRCSAFELEGQRHPMDHVIPADLKAHFDQLSRDGFRVLAIAYRDLEPKPAYSKDDEKDLVLRGYLAFLDPPKDTARATLNSKGQCLKVVDTFRFGSAIGDPSADKILRALRTAGPAGMTRTEIREYFGRNLESEVIGRALGALEECDLARSEKQTAGDRGRPAERWFIV